MAESESMKNKDNGDEKDSKKEKPSALSKLAKTASEAKTLFISIIVVIGVLAFVTNIAFRVVDEDIIVDSISIPPPVKDFGYTESIISHKFLDAIGFPQIKYRNSWLKSDNWISARTGSSYP